MRIVNLILNIAAVVVASTVLILVWDNLGFTGAAILFAVIGLNCVLAAGNLYALLTTERHPPAPEDVHMSIMLNKAFNNPDKIVFGNVNDDGELEVTMADKKEKHEDCSRKD